MLTPKLLTVDVWDTLLRRKAHPDCIKLATARFILMQFNKRLATSYLSSEQILNARFNCENKLKQQGVTQGNDGEFLFDAVIDNWLKMIFLPNQIITQQDIKTVLDYELTREMESNTFDPEIAHYIARYQADKILFLSDFYLSSDHLLGLIRYWPALHFIKEGISSGDIGLNKRSGRLFDHVRTQYNLQPNEHYHVGDDLFADVIMARRKGGLAQHYKPEKQHQLRLFKNALFANRPMLFYFLFSHFFALEDSQPNNTAYCSGLYKALTILCNALTYIEQQQIQGKITTNLEIPSELYSLFPILAPKGYMFSMPTFICTKNIPIDNDLKAEQKAIQELTAIWGPWLDAYVVTSHEMNTIIQGLKNYLHSSPTCRSQLRSTLVNQALPSWSDLLSACYNQKDRSKLRIFCVRVSNPIIFKKFNFPFWKCLPAITIFVVFYLVRNILQFKYRIESKVKKICHLRHTTSDDNH